MPPMVKTFILIILLLFSCPSSGRPNGTKDGVKLTNPHNEVIIQMKERKLIGIHTMMDYSSAIANPVHDPPPVKGKP
ncbi:hypothetical protein F0562_007784 [Nyssa sinensis]|uniref:Uncharacterized protein n=1 Tax=Nyssa sinensis TaxID=561372 RepID=A0A5J5A8H2_9ASTE|nr:hypothetical protein F0562_007784 [Nyssa sinensis]